MFKKIAALAALGILCTLAIAQDKSPAWTVEKGYRGGTAKWAVPDKTVSATWDAIMETAFAMKDTKASGDKPSGTVKISRPGARIQILVAQKNSGVNIVAQWEFEAGEKAQLRSPFSQAKIFFNEFFPRVAEVLK